MARLSPFATCLCWLAAASSVLTVSSTLRPRHHHDQAAIVKSILTWQQHSKQHKGDHGQREKVPQPTLSGYLDVSHNRGTSMFYAYFEAQEGTDAKQQAGSTNPIILWLQGGPGCSSMFGMLYINGPYFMHSDLMLTRNPGTWNRLYGMLFIDQPLGTGYSTVSTDDFIPTDELGVAKDLFHALQSFYRQFPHFQQRPLVITGESYAGKYVPSIAHYILQMDAIVSGTIHTINHPRDIPAEDVQDPLFTLGGIGIGNGFTDAVPQTLVQADVAWAFGLIDLKVKRVAEALQQEVVDLVLSKKWRQARIKSDALNELITNASWTATLEDVRRNVGYDGPDLSTQFLNQEHVKDALKVPREIAWTSCSLVVDEKLAGDVMRSVRILVHDLLRFCPVLLYQGQFDAECGVASNDAWVSTMAWEQHAEWMKTDRQLWQVNGRAAGYMKEVGQLRNVVIRNTGHMVPHDNPLVAQLMIEKWIEERIVNNTYTRDQEVTPQMERDLFTDDQGQDANPANWVKPSR